MYILFIYFRNPANVRFRSLTTDGLYRIPNQTKQVVEDPKRNQIGPPRVGAGVGVGMLRELKKLTEKNMN